jgi:hypothetical protein
LEPRTLIPVCLEELRATFDPARRLFTERLNLVTGENEGISPRYSAIALIGARAAERRGWPTDLPLADVEATLASLAPRLSNVGDVALALWASLEGSREASRDLARLLCERLERDDTPARHATMELSWSSVALDLFGAAFPDDKERNATVADSVAREILEAFHPDGHLFPYLSPRSPGPFPKGWFYRRFGTFANQTYPIYALARHHALAGAARALEAARLCAQRVCSLQGPLGQWWWTYDVRRGAVAERFPVFSVHQTGMGPMALQQLERAGGPSFREPIARGLDWLDRRNELGLSFFGGMHGSIKRAIRRRGPRRLLYHLNVLRSAVGMSPVSNVLDAASGLEVVDECRSYEAGWALTFLCEEPEGRP